VRALIAFDAPAASHHSPQADALVRRHVPSGGRVLLTLTYVLVRQGFQPAPQKVREIVAQKLNIPLSQLEPSSRGYFQFSQPGLGPPGGLTMGRLIHEIQAEQMQQQLNDLITWSAVRAGHHGRRLSRPRLVVAGRLLRPVHELTSLARRLSESTLHERIRLQRPPDELKELGDTFDAMLERLTGRSPASASSWPMPPRAPHSIDHHSAPSWTWPWPTRICPARSWRRRRPRCATPWRAARRLSTVCWCSPAATRWTETEAVDLAELVRQSLERYAAEADAAGLGAEAGSGAVGG